MRNLFFLAILIVLSENMKSQEIDTLFLHIPKNKDTITYKRIVEFDENTKLYHVRDYYKNGQIQMDATYSALDKFFKEEYQCNYHSNTKQGLYQTWYKNGMPDTRCTFVDGRFQGQKEEWYPNGQIGEKSYWIKGDIENGKGQMQGSFKKWSKEGIGTSEMFLDKGLKIKPKDTNYHYISYTPKEYKKDSLKKWPLIIYLHGGTRRGTDLKKLYASGIPDQIWRGREFPFIIVAPQCPLGSRWSTDDWFENFYNEITTKYNVDTDKVYLTGVSLGGAGTWYLAIKYPDKFAAIAPMSGFTSHIEYLNKNIDKLVDMPIWAFHGKIDKVVQFEETERVALRLEGKNKNLKFTAEPDVGHWMEWLVYPEEELYDWFLKHDRRMKAKN
jgi:pimeloyl-ACP methyl ester carboxylesterase